MVRDFFKESYQDEFEIEDGIAFDLIPITETQVILYSVINKDS